MKYRCYFYKDKDLWLGFCVDLNLACQADTGREAALNILHQIDDYVTSANTESPADRRHLLNRQSPLSIRAHYHIRLFLHLLGIDKTVQFFTWREVKAQN